MRHELVVDLTERLGKALAKARHFNEQDRQQLAQFIKTLPREEIEYVAHAHVRFVSPCAQRVLAVDFQ
jgi:leucyl aminopeptidase (aminopeptidase T)